MKSLLSKFKKRIDIPNENGCILWKGYKNYSGYGMFSIKGKYFKAHRFAFSIWKGELIEYLEEEANTSQCCSYPITDGGRCSHCKEGV